MVAAVPLRRRPPLWVGAGLGVVGMAPCEVTEAMSGTGGPGIDGAGCTPGNWGLGLGGEGEAPHPPEKVFGERTSNNRFCGGATGGFAKIGSSLEPEGLPVVGLNCTDPLWLWLWPGLQVLSLILIRGGLLAAGRGTGSPLEVVRSLAMR